MRKWVIVLAIGIMLLPSLCYAGIIADNLSKLPGVKQGIGWDIEDEDLLNITSVDAVTWGEGRFGMKEDKIGLGGGIATDFDDTTYPVATLNYKLGGLQDFGFSYPLQEFVNIEVGGFLGRDIDSNSDKDWHWGVQANIIQIKF